MPGAAMAMPPPDEADPDDIAPLLIEESEDVDEPEDIDDPVDDPGVIEPAVVDELDMPG